jgi:hypothetical protein
MQLDISADEAAVLADVLDSALREIREEVYKAEVTEYRASLKQREAVISGILQRLAARPTPG